jgi:hypothetical protein
MADKVACVSCRNKQLKTIVAASVKVLASANGEKDQWVTVGGPLCVDCAEMSVAEFIEEWGEEWERYSAEEEADG